jgi:hypothetical protein
LFSDCVESNAFLKYPAALIRLPAAVGVKIGLYVNVLYKMILKQQCLLYQEWVSGQSMVNQWFIHCQ